MVLAPPETLEVEAALDELALYLRPPGQGIHAVSSGRQALEAATRRYLGPSWAPDRPWRTHLEVIPSLRGPGAVALLAVPSDAGAGIVRGAARGPEAIRAAFGTAPAFDLGDVFCVPHFLDDAMLSEAQQRRSQDALYPAIAEDRRRLLPVSPIDLTTRALRLLRRLNPELRILVLGGDHTVAWPVFDALFPEGADHRDVGIVHFDAHTDLIETRLGVRYCFATWAYHANQRIGRGGRLLQLGVRTSARPRMHWESSLDVRQVWPAEFMDLGVQGLAELTVAHLLSRGVRRVYVSNDLDGTDAQDAAACGTPEPNGLSREMVEGVLRAVGQAGFSVVGADVVELAPGLSLDRAASERSVETAVRYVRAELELLARSNTSP